MTTPPQRSPITSHILDAHAGKPAQGIRVLLKKEVGPDTATYQVIGQDVTNADGRCTALLPVGSPVSPGRYCLHFATQPYFTQRHESTFYPCVEIHFTIDDPCQHYHIPLLLSSHSYTTYRGS